MQKAAHATEQRRQAAVIEEQTTGESCVCSALVSMSSRSPSCDDWALLRWLRKMTDWSLDG